MTLQLSITRRVTGKTPKCFLNALEKCLWPEKPTRRATVFIDNSSPRSKSRQARAGMEVLPFYPNRSTHCQVQTTVPCLLPLRRAQISPGPWGVLWEELVRIKHVGGPLRQEGFEVEDREDDAIAEDRDAP